MTNTGDERRANLLEKVTAYISNQKQWFQGVFTKWQVFNNPPGYANTNSPIESFNATFKRDFAKRIKCSVYRALNKIADCAEYYLSARNNYFNKKPKFDQAVKDKATSIALKCFKKLKDKVVYTSSFDK